MLDVIGSGGGGGRLSNVLSLELVNDARLANSSLKLFDERLSEDNVGDDVELIDVS